MDPSLPRRRRGSRCEKLARPVVVSTQPAVARSPKNSTRRGVVVRGEEARGSIEAAERSGNGDRTAAARYARHVPDSSGALHSDKMAQSHRRAAVAPSLAARAKRPGRIPRPSCRPPQLAAFSYPCMTRHFPTARGREAHPAIIMLSGLSSRRSPSRLELIKNPCSSLLFKILVGQLVP